LIAAQTTDEDSELELEISVKNIFLLGIVSRMDSFRFFRNVDENLHLLLVTFLFVTLTVSICSVWLAKVSSKTLEAYWSAREGKLRDMDELSHNLGKSFLVSS
jgi:uncharacterized membrane protein AbrB (regulator of aidB expression)